MNTLKNIAIELSASQTLSNHEIANVMGGCYRHKRTYRSCCIKKTNCNPCSTNNTSTNDTTNNSNTDNVDIVVE